MEHIVRVRSGNANRMVLRKHDLQIYDNILNPFESISASHEFLQMTSVSDDSSLISGFHIMIDN